MYSILFLWLIFSNSIDARVSFLSYWDELFTAVVLLWHLIAVFKDHRCIAVEIKKWIPLLLLICIGFAGNILHPGLQETKSVLFRDVVALIKFPAIFIAMQKRPVSTEEQEQIIATTAGLSRWIILITFAAAVVGYFVDIGVYDIEVRITKVFIFIFSHPTFLVSSYAILAAALMAESIKKNRIYILMDCLIIFMAQRTKGYAFVLFVMLVLILGEKNIAKLLTGIFGAHEKKGNITRLIPALLGMTAFFALIGKNKVEKYLTLGMAEARGALYITGLKIMKDYFPVGSGFGTFASFLSGRYYSNLYALYGIDNAYGMTPDYFSFIADTFWPYIYGQFGVFGLLIYAGQLISVFFRQMKAAIADNSRIAIAVIWIYALIASTSEAFFTNTTGVQMALYLTMFVGCISDTPALKQKNK